jgi:predicted NBD/HSP70 family sugar kinase
MAIRERQSMLPSDLRVANSLKIVGTIRAATSMSHSEVAREVGLSVPAVHRLMSELVAAELVDEDGPVSETVAIGRPAATYRFRGEAGFLAGIDVGNGTTRIVLSDLNLNERASLSFLTSDLRTSLSSVLSEAVLRMRVQQGAGEIPLVGVGIGVSASVDPRTGEMHSLPVLKKYEGLRLSQALEDVLGCPVAVQQDDHYSALAESSDLGSSPGASSLLVLEIGYGIGVGMCFRGQPLQGFRGRFGRIAGWPVSVANEYLPGSTLGEVLTTPGLVQQYRNRGGHSPIHDGLGLVEVTRGGELEAVSVLEWAAQEIVQTIKRLYLLCDPEVVVLGGGLSQAYEVFAAAFKDQLPEVEVVPSRLKDRAVVTGAILEASGFVDAWLRRRLLRARRAG